MNEHQNLHHYNQPLHLSPSSIDLQNLKALSVLGRGAKGVVFLIQNDDKEQEQQLSSSKQNLALKVISKSSIENKRKTNQQQGKLDDDEGVDLYKRIWFERDVLNLFNHPLLPKLKGLVITDEIVGFAIDYCSGGDLNTLRKQQSEKMFSDDIIRFYAAELVLALEYLHDLGIIYRDLKPENVMIQENGHLMIVDFDLSTKISSRSSEKSHSHSSSPSSSSSSPVNKPKKKKRFPSSFFTCTSGSDDVTRNDESVSASNSMSSTENEKSNSFVGTEEYVAPEIIEGNGHDFSVDWWSLGVVMYEMLYGKTPFRGINRKETFYRILTKSPELVGDQTALRDLIRKLLEKDPNQRISVEGIKGHEFFRGLDWDLVTQISRPPFIPSRGSLNGEDMEGIKGIDVKSFVQMVFDGSNVDLKKEDGIGTGTENVKGDENKGEGVWVEGLSNSTKNEDFLMF